MKPYFFLGSQVCVISLIFLVKLNTPTTGEGFGTRHGPFKRFEYTYSFKGPYLAQPDGSIPFWERRGHALPHDSNIRITPSLRNQRGAVWTKNPCTFEDWEVELVFRISGRGKTGGDGMGFWYVEEKPEVGLSGNIFGAFNGPWKGLAILWDTYDNDGASNNPALVGILNNGSKVYEHDKDGMYQQFAFHKKDYRNQMFYARTRITYNKNSLSVYMSNGRTRDTAVESDLEPMFFSYGLNLTSGGYFGVSAATGSVFADDHDVAKFLTWSLHDAPTLSGGVGGQGQVHGQGAPSLQDIDSEVEAEKYKKEFLEWQQKLDKQRAEYKAEHPTEAKSEHDDIHDPEDDSYRDDEYMTEIRRIFMEQSAARYEIIYIGKRLDEVLGKHEALTSGVVRYYHSMPRNEDGAVPSAPAPSVATTIPQRYEVENILTGNRELLSTTADIKILAAKMADPGIKNKPMADFPGIPSNNDVTEDIAEAIREIAALQSGIKLIYTRLSEEGGSFDDSTGCEWSCISTKSFILLNLACTALFLALVMYREQQVGQGAGSAPSTNISTKQRFY